MSSGKEAKDSRSGALAAINVTVKLPNGEKMKDRKPAIFLERKTNKRTILELRLF